MHSVETILTSSLPPGCEEAMKALFRLRDKEKLPHALLFVGPRGVGKSQSANQLATAILTSSYGQDASRISALIDAGTHPDLIKIAVETGKSAISVDQIRVLADKLSLTPHYGDIKIAIIEPAESMTTAASNALLKTLEEPPGDSLIILLSSNKGRLPQTIKSRCRQVLFHRPKFDWSIQWLSTEIDPEEAETCLTMAQGAPLLAQSYHARGLADSYHTLISGLSALIESRVDPLSIAASCSDMEPSDLLGWIRSMVRALIRRKMLGESDLTIGTNTLNHLKISANSIDLDRLFAYEDFLQQAEREIGANLNRELILEEVMIRWSALANP